MLHLYLQLLVLIQVLEELQENLKLNRREILSKQQQDNPKAVSPGSSAGIGTQPKTLAKQAAETRYGDAKDYYLAAVKKAKETPRSYMKPTKDPGFAQNDPSIYLPKKD